MCKGITDAVLKESGNTPSEIHLFMINVIRVTILSPHILRMFGPMPSKPVDLFGLRDCKLRFTSIADIGLISK